LTASEHSTAATPAAAAAEAAAAAAEEDCSCCCRRPQSVRSTRIPSPPPATSSPWTKTDASGGCQEQRERQADAKTGLGRRERPVGPPATGRVS